MVRLDQRLEEKKRNKRWEKYLVWAETMGNEKTINK